MIFTVRSKVMKKQEFIERYGEEAYKRLLEHQREYSKQYNQQYYQQHKEEIREQQNQHYQQHKEEIKEYSKKYYQQHKEELRERNKQYRRKNEYMFAFCIPEEIERIENYELAKKDNFKGWCIHHRLETHNSDGEKRLVNLSMAELKALDMYYNRPANELIFLTKSEHTKLHRRKKNREGL